MTPPSAPPAADAGGASPPPPFGPEPAPSCQKSNTTGTSNNSDNYRRIAKVVKKIKGRWTLGEHHRFLVGFERFGKDWKGIQTLVQTRTIVQIRTHAQKYLIKLAKGRPFPEEPYVYTEDDPSMTDSEGSDSDSHTTARNDSSTPPLSPPLATTGNVSTPKSRRSPSKRPGSSAHAGGTSPQSTASSRGKELARLGAPSAVAAPRATRARAAAAVALAAATAAAAATATGGGAVGAAGPEGSEEDEGREGEDIGEGDVKRRRIARPASADIVAGPWPSERVMLKGTGGFVFTKSQARPHGEGFRGKRLSVGGGGGGGGIGAGSAVVSSGPFPRAELHVNTALGGSYMDHRPAIVTPTFQSGGTGLSAGWSTIGNLEGGTASEAGSPGLAAWGVDIDAPRRHKSPFLSESFLEELLVSGKDDETDSPADTPTGGLSSSASSTCSCSHNEGHARRFLAANFPPMVTPVTPVPIDRGQQIGLSPARLHRCVAGNYAYGYPSSSAAVGVSAPAFALDPLPTMPILTPQVTARDAGFSTPCGGILDSGSPGLRKTARSWSPTAARVGGAAGPCSDSAAARICRSSSGAFAGTGVFGGVDDGGGPGGGGGGSSVSVSMADPSSQLELLFQPGIGGDLPSVDGASAADIHHHHHQQEQQQQQQQSSVPTVAPEGWFESSVGESCVANAVVGASLGDAVGVEESPYVGNWMGCDDVAGGMGTGEDVLTAFAGDPDAIALFAFEDYFGML